MGIVEEAHNVKVLGSAGSEQTIVLAHGFGTNQSVWKHLVPHLVEDYRVVLFDKMGAGTTNPDYFDFDRYSGLQGYAYDVIAILEELQLYSCIYVGHSVSAMIGALASVTRPDLFTKIIMVSASPRYPSIHPSNYLYSYVLSNYSLITTSYISPRICCFQFQIQSLIFFPNLTISIQVCLFVFFNYYYFRIFGEGEGGKISESGRYCNNYATWWICSLD